MGKTKAELIDEELYRLASEVEVLKSFICETPELREKFVQFTKTPIRPHNLLVNNCVCSTADHKVKALANQKAFYDYEEPLMIPFMEDPEFDEKKRLENEKFKAVLNEQVIPVFEKLHQLEPLVITKEYVTWISKNPTVHELRHYLDWLIPTIMCDTLVVKRVLKNPEAIAMIEELAANIGIEPTWQKT